MPVAVLQSYYPNVKSIQDVTSSTTWGVLATDGNRYTSLASLVSAGKTAFPGLDPGAFPGLLFLKCLAAGGITDGSPILFEINKATQPADDSAAQEISASGQAQDWPGGFIYNLWIRKTTAGDIVQATVRY